ncbi:hypothetical protein [Microcoleus sp. POL1_C1]|uniref:hypothetical protein n=1 Tax=Microcoleus sp. POL1_C1 TaxID=2818870 RepID=UPI002FCFEAAE
MLSPDLQRTRSRYFDSWLSCFYLDHRLDRGLVNAGNRLYCKKVKHLICDNNSPRDRSEAYASIWATSSKLIALRASLLLPPVLKPQKFIQNLKY